jgi:hypothetical protein
MAACGEGAQTRAMGHRARQGFFLRDLEIERDSFCKLTTKETVDGGRVTVAVQSTLGDGEGSLR